jgi:hypothetical protein
MAWRDWLGLSPSREQFAHNLIRHMSNSGASGWSYDAAEAALVHTDARQFFVNNAWREYSSASGAGRRTLLEKWTSLEVNGSPVVAVPNRGVLLATGADDPEAVLRLVDEARRSMQERPWPLSATLLQRVGGDWQPMPPDARIASATRTFG